EREQRTSDFRERAAKAKKQAENERVLRDKWQAERNELQTQNERTQLEINRTKIGPRPSQPHGGAHKDIPTAGGERNHIPPHSVLPKHISPDRGPAIGMEKGDHLETNSWGRGAIKPTSKYQFKTAEEWRAAQNELIKEGKFKEAVQMDIDDIRAKFGLKYERG